MNSGGRGDEGGAVTYAIWFRRKYSIGRGRVKEVAEASELKLAIACLLMVIHSP